MNLVALFSSRHVLGEARRTSLPGQHFLAKAAAAVPTKDLPHSGLEDPTERCDHNTTYYQPSTLSPQS